MSKRKGVAAAANELAPVADRLGLLLVVRLFMASIVMIMSFVLPHLQLHPDVIIAARIYVGLAIALELLHRFLTKVTRFRWLIVVNAMLLIDGLFVATVLAGSGSARSTFVFLAYAHIVSV